MVRPVAIAGRPIGVGHPCFIVAEVGVNHNGDIGLAQQLVEHAAAAGADAVKFQTFRADRLVTAEGPKASYQMQGPDDRESQLQMLRRLELSVDAHQRLFDYCQQKDIVFMSTPFDEESADDLSRLGVQMFKIASGDITDLRLLAHVAKKGKPVILSTGMSRLDEVETAVHTMDQAGAQEIVLLHCVSDYPAQPADANLRAMQTMADALQRPVGYSDHTPGIEVSLAAVALGACVIEKHLTVDRTMPGPDHRASLEPSEFATMVRGIRIVEQALGHGRKEPVAKEQQIAVVARKSLVAACDIPAGCQLQEEWISVKRPGTGLPSIMLPQLLGRTVKQDIPRGTVLTLEMLA